MPTMTQKLTFTTASVQNLVISNPTDALYYEVLTPEWESHQTTVRRLDTRAQRYDTVGSIRNQSGKPVAVSMYNGEFINEGLWLRKIEGQDRQSRWEFDDGEGNYFSWAVAGPNFELRSLDEGGVQSPNPIATFFPHKRYVKVAMISQHAFLEIESSVVESLDTVLGAVCWSKEKKALTMLQFLYSCLLRNGESAVFEQALGRVFRHSDIFN